MPPGVQLAGLDFAFLHVLHAHDEDLLRFIRDAWPTSLIANDAGRPRVQMAGDVDRDTFYGGDEHDDTDYPTRLAAEYPR